MAKAGTENMEQGNSKFRTGKLKYRWLLTFNLIPCSMSLIACLLLFFCCLLFTAEASAAHFPSPRITNKASYFLGGFQINGLSAEAGDEVAFFDPQGMLCGLYVVTTAGEYGVVAVYGDDTTTSLVDEGAGPGDALTVKIWDAGAGVELEGSSLVLTAGAPMGGSFTASEVPPVWEDNAGYVLNIDTATYFTRPNPMPSVSNYLGNLTIMGGPAETGDEIAAYDPEGILIGQFRVTTPGKYGIMQLYGDDTGTASVDEGARSGDALSFKVWDRSTGIEYGMSNLSLSSGPPAGSFVASAIPPVWTQDTGYVLDIGAGQQVSVQYSLRLNSGWNFISIPVQPADTVIETLLGDVLSSVIIVWGYDNENKVWQKYMPGGTNNSLVGIEPGRGYWIKMNNTGSLSVTGSEASHVVHLYEGWNLIGYAGTNGADISTELSEISGKWDIVWNYNRGMWKFRSDTLGLPLPPLTALTRGKAYWIKIKTGAGAPDWTQ